MDCSDKFYHKNKFGYSLKCECHGAVHVTFGTVSLLLSRPQVSDFACCIAEAIMSECDVEDRNSRSIFLPTRDYFLMFAMTYNELKLLSEILDQTLLMMEIGDVLNS
ncbi:MAG: hypothetical protein C0490_21150 [Marivirga sp.]|nr:hypothetical protein [Marivirga sp.]